MMNPPAVAGWNLVLRICLELGALAGLSVGAWNFTSGSIRWIAVVVAPISAAALWGVFNVVGDPSRSGAAPVEVAGWIRLTIEVIVLGGGAAGLFIAGHRNIAIAGAALAGIHCAASWRRIQWLLFGPNSRLVAQ